MLVYEKKVDNARHLFGNYEGTVPTANDPQLTYKDAQGNVITPIEKDTYLDDKHGGIIRKSDGKAVNVFIGTHQIIPKNAVTDEEVQVEVEPIEEPIIEEEPEVEEIPEEEEIEE